MQNTKLKSLIPLFENSNRVETKTTVLKPRTTYYHECPHCLKEIHEKHTYSEFYLDENKQEKLIEYHSDCRKPIEFYKTPEEQQEINNFLERLSKG